MTQIQEQIQPRIQPGHIQLSPVQTSSSLIDAQIQPMFSTATVKVTTDLIQTTSSTNPITSVATICANRPIFGKAIVDQSEQTIPENIVQQIEVNEPSEQLAETKSDKANLIQLTPTQASTSLVQFSSMQGRHQLVLMYHFFAQLHTSIFSDQIRTNLIDTRINNTAHDDDESEVTSSTDMNEFGPEPDSKPDCSSEDVIGEHEEANEKGKVNDLNSMFPHSTPP